jgi:hypothetical protein
MSSCINIQASIIYFPQTCYPPAVGLLPSHLCLVFTLMNELLCSASVFLFLKPLFLENSSAFLDGLLIT